VKKVCVGLLLLLFSLPGHLYAACTLSAIAVGDSEAGSWTSECDSTHRNGSYAQYYTFTLLTPQSVTIDLESSVDTYLFLLDGVGEESIIIDEDDDSGSGADSRITISLPIGAYTIEATTDSASKTGDFVVTVTSDSAPNPGPCENLISTDNTVEDSWGPACESENRPGRYAKYFIFTLIDDTKVTIDLESTPDNYLFLLEGAGLTGKVISEDDDGGTGDNARIVTTLSAGTYTVEATTYANATTGTFSITVRTDAPDCDDCSFVINSGLNDAWFNPVTNGQGFNVTVYPKIKQVFVTWFTYDVERPPEDVTAMLADPGHRWLTAQGPYEGNKATLTIFVTEGGVFDSARPRTSTDQDGDGTLVLEFYNCTDGLATYDITSLDIQNEIPIERIVLDNVELCEILSEP
jgi:hypothetical protein